MESQLPVRITVLTINYTPEPSGVAPYAAGLAEGLQERGHTVGVLTSYPHYPQWTSAAGRPWSVTELISGVPVRRHKHYIPSRPTQIARGAHELSFGFRLALAPFNNTDLVLCTSPALLASAIAVARLRLSSKRMPIGLIVQDVYSLGLQQTGGDSFASPFVREIERRVLRSVDGIAVIHQRMADAIQRELRIPAERMKVIRNWAHVEPSAGSDRSEFRRLMGWAPHELVVMHTGAMGVKQDLENVVNAGRLADAEGQPVRFVLVGHGSERPKLECAARTVKSVQILDPLAEQHYRRALAAADVLLVNERRGVVDMAVPSKLTTYFAAGRPVVAATDQRSSTADELAAAGAGWRVEPDAPAELLQAVMHVAVDPGEAMRKGLRAQDYARKILARTRALDLYDEWSHELIVRAESRKAFR